MSVPDHQLDPEEYVECDLCGDDPDGPDPFCHVCEGTGWIHKSEAQRRADDQRDAERADNWRGD